MLELVAVGPKEVFRVCRAFKTTFSLDEKVILSKNVKVTISTNFYPLFT